MSEEFLKTDCCIAGGGPAGIMAGYLLARAGVDVVVLEKHADFFRDFRGDTIHPSTLRVVDELGLLDEFLKVPHNEIRELSARFGDTALKLADFRHVPGRCKFMMLMPQWDFLNFMAEHGRALPTFHLMMNAEATDLIRGNGRIVGVTAQTPQGTLSINADLVIAADGRSSKLRELAGLEVLDIGAPIDVLWMRISRQPGDPHQTLGRFQDGKILVTLNRDDYWQCAYVIQKAEFEAIKQGGLPAFRKTIETVAPFLRGRTDELKAWEDIKLLSVAVDRLRRWSRPGLLCIGDSAHAMSPIGGVGINLAIQDAVAAANILVQPILGTAVTSEKLQEVRKRREFPTKMTQGFQVFAHKRFITRALNRRTPLLSLPLPLQLLKQFPILRRIPARLLGLGFRPEHVQTPDMNHGTGDSAIARSGDLESPDGH